MSPLAEKKTFCAFSLAATANDAHIGIMLGVIGASIIKTCFLFSESSLYWNKGHLPMKEILTGVFHWKSFHEGIYAYVHSYYINVTDPAVLIDPRVPIWVMTQKWSSAACVEPF